MRVGVAPLGETTRGWIHEAGNDGFIKLVEDADRGVLVGATSAGPAGGEVLGALAVAVHAEVPIDRAALDDLRLPDLPPRHRGRARPPRLSPFAPTDDHWSVALPGRGASCGVSRGFHDQRSFVGARGRRGATSVRGRSAAPAPGDTVSAWHSDCSPSTSTARPSTTWASSRTASATP